jgi:hypothetical protein
MFIETGNTVTTWAPSTSYAVGDYVETSASLTWSTGQTYQVGTFIKNGANSYYCLTKHIAGTFATDLASGYWILRKPVYYCTYPHTSAAAFSTDFGVAFWLEQHPATITVLTLSGSAVATYNLTNGGSLFEKKQYSTSNATLK